MKRVSRRQAEEILMGPGGDLDVLDAVITDLTLDHVAIEGDDPRRMTLEDSLDAHGVDADMVRGFLQQIRGIRTLRRREEVALGVASRAGVAEMNKRQQGLQHDLATIHQGNESRRGLIEAHLRLVLEVSVQYVTPDTNLLDLIQEGSTGLMQAVARYDPGKGYRFSPYAVWWIHHALIRASRGGSHDPGDPDGDGPPPPGNVLQYRQAMDQGGAAPADSEQGICL